LQVVTEPNAQGACRCKLFHRYGNPLGKAALAYRCVKLGTTKAPLQVRVEDAVTMKPRPGVQVWVSQEGFAVDPKERINTGSNGFAKTRDPIRGSPM